MLDFLCRWEVIQKGSTESHIPQMEKIIRILFVCLLVCGFAFIFHHKSLKNTLK